MDTPAITPAKVLFMDFRTYRVISPLNQPCPADTSDSFPNNQTWVLFQTLHEGRQRIRTARTMTAHPVDKTHTTATKQDEPCSAATAWHVLDEVADVRFLPSGLPLALRWRGRLWQVIGTPMSWSSSSSWWEPSTTPPGGQGGQGGQGRMLTTRFWRFQAQTGPASPVLEFDMSADPRWQDWRLRRVAGVNGF
ncbi:DUF6504 family protein [Arthrobacter sp. MDT1-48-3]